MDRVSYTYILASCFRGTLYTGVTSDLMRRLWEHRTGIRSRFPSRYSVFRLVWWEAFGDIELAIRREKQIKRWHRSWKVNLIEATNPHWEDLAIALGFERLPEEPKGSVPPNPSCLTCFSIQFGARGAAEDWILKQVQDDDRDDSEAPR